MVTLDTFGAAGNGLGNAVIVAHVPKPSHLNKRANSLPENLSRVEKSTQRLFWFIPVQTNKHHLSNENVEKASNSNEYQVSEEVGRRWANMAKKFLEKRNSVDVAMGLSEEGVDEELLGLEILESASKSYVQISQETQ
jgi:hypothetical protein